MSRALALPRIRVRSRRRKPRGPEWWYSALWLAAVLLVMFVAIVGAVWLTAAGMALHAFVYSRQLRWWPADPEGPRPSAAQQRTNVVLLVAGLALALTALVVP